MTATAKWITRLRSSCPKGWSVRNMRGKIYLSIRSGAGGKRASTATLPLAWAADTVPEAISLIADLQQRVDKEGFDLRDALNKVKAPVPSKSPSVASEWPDLVEKFQADLQVISPVKTVSWERNYAPFLNRIIELMASSTAPINARSLAVNLIEPWSDMPTNRGKAIKCLRLFLDFAVEVHNLPAESWTLTDRSIKQLRGAKAERRTVATISDVEILRLLDSLADSDAANRWRNAIKMMTLYGLRPEELNHLVVKDHPETSKPAMYCTYQKVCNKSKTAPRWLMPLPLKNLAGNVVDWNLAGAMAIKQLPMPPLGDKYAVKTFLDRQKVWTELREKYEECGEWLRPYSFRNSYSLRAHRIGHRNDVICMAMGHSLSSHETNYEWARSESVLEHI